MAAAQQRDLLLRHAERVEAQIETLRTHLGYLREKAAVWDAELRRQHIGVGNRDFARLYRWIPPAQRSADAFVYNKSLAEDAYVNG